MSPKLWAGQIARALSFAGCIGVSLLSRRLFTACLRFAVILLVISAVFSFPVSAQKASTSHDAQVEDALFMCLSRKLNVRPSELRDVTDPDRATDPNTGRNYVYDHEKQAWIDAKTGECICPTCTSTASHDAQVEDELFMCLSRKLNVRPSELRDITDPDRATDPNTGRNYVYDHKKQAWIDAKTGECICPTCTPPEQTKKVAVRTPSATAPQNTLVSMQVGGGVGFNNIGGTSGDRAAFLNSFPGGTFSTSANTFAGNVGSSLGIGPVVFDFNAWRSTASDSKGSGPVLGGGTDTALINQQFQGLSLTAGGKIPLGGKASLIIRGGGNFWHANIDTKETVANGTTSTTVTNSRGVDGRGWTTGAALQVDMSSRWSVVVRYDYLPMNNAGVNVHLNEGSVGVMFRLFGVPGK